MLRFFFDIADASGPGLDDVGTDFSDAESACAAAMAVLPSIAASSRMMIEGTNELTATVRDESGRPIYRTVLCLRGERIPSNA